ncbi:DUF4410 domain-containing protein [Campylobacter coli]|nr:DUF4410 domain-containing protein [Campylobacter coli]MBX2352706.1 DUF4410 domain-containing protein [Campylobacter coli]
MMRKVILYSFAILFLSACSYSQINNVSQRNVIDADRKFSSAYAECEQNSEESRYLNDKINELLKNKKIYGKDIKIECKISNYDEGSRALRYFISFGAGAAKAKIEVKLTDDNNQTISTFSNDAILPGGLFGGESKGVFDNAASGIVEYVKKTFIDKNKYK